MVRTTLMVLSALPLMLASADAAACRMRPGNVTVAPVVNRPDSAHARAAALERQARSVDQQAVAHASRAELARATAARLEEILPASFGEQREAIFERIDALLERAAVETGEARTLRLRASDLRSEAARLRASNGGTWRRDVPRSTAVDL
jgi:hypothetical protein